MTEKNQNKFKPMKFSVHHDAYVDHTGYEYKEYNSEFESPFVPDGLNRYCWVIYRGFFGSYKIRECIVTAIVYTNCWLWKMDNGWTFFSDKLGITVFEYNDLSRAIEICEKKNKLRKVRIKRLGWG